MTKVHRGRSGFCIFWSTAVTPDLSLKSHFSKEFCDIVHIFQTSFVPRHTSFLTSHAISTLFPQCPRPTHSTSPPSPAAYPSLSVHRTSCIFRLPLSRTKNGYPSCNEYNRFSAVSQYKSSHFPSRSGSKLLVTPNRRPLPAFVSLSGSLISL